MDPKWSIWKRELTVNCQCRMFRRSLRWQLRFFPITTSLIACAWELESQAHNTPSRTWQQISAAEFRNALGGPLDLASASLDEERNYPTHFLSAELQQPCCSKTLLCHYQL